MTGKEWLASADSISSLVVLRQGIPGLDRPFSAVETEELYNEVRQQANANRFTSRDERR